MMRWIVGSSLKFRYLVVAAAAALMVFGVVQLRDTPVDVFPEFAPPQGRGPDDHARALGRRASRSSSPCRSSRRSTGCPTSTSIRSKSVPQLSPIALIFERGTDLLEARQLVQERIGERHADAADAGQRRRS